MRVRRLAPSGSSGVIRRNFPVSLYRRPRVPTHLTQTRCLRIKEQPIEWNKTVKYLGVEIDSKLTFKEQAAKVVAKAYGARSGLAPILNNRATPHQAKRTIYNHYIRSQLPYATPAWAGLLTKGRLDKLEVEERKLLRSLFNVSSRTSNENLYKNTGTLKLRITIKSIAEEYFNKLRNNEAEKFNLLGEEKKRERDKYKRPEEVLKI